MPLQIVIGMQWGDEGKGRIVDLLAAESDIAARFNGGDNAGHTVTVGAQTFKLHLIPSGLIHPHTIGVMGGGMVINPATLLEEMAALRASGLRVDAQRLRISYAAHIITPAHRALDVAQEAALGAGKIGTTGRGIGPAYTERAARRGLRMQDMLTPETFRQKLIQHVEEVNARLTQLYHAQPLDAQAVAAEYLGYAEQLRDHICDVGAVVESALHDGLRVLAEGAQGSLLDLDWGTYPFVTSSTTTALAAMPGLGIGITPVERVIGVTKAFQTRVGSGPFPTELTDATAEALRGTGAQPWDEFGTTTGRPRRVGWLDGVLLRYTVRINGATELVLTKLDVLSGLPELKLCVGYRAHGQTYENLPMGLADLGSFEPVYETLPGWKQDLTAARDWSDLPPAAKLYIRRVEEISGVMVRQVSVGPERDQVVDLSQ